MFYLYIIALSRKLSDLITDLEQKSWSILFSEKSTFSSWHVLKYIYTLILYLFH